MFDLLPVLSGNYASGEENGDDDEDDFDMYPESIDFLEQQVKCSQCLAISGTELLSDPSTDSSSGNAEAPGNEYYCTLSYLIALSLLILLLGALV